MRTLPPLIDPDTGGSVWLQMAPPELSSLAPEEAAEQLYADAGNTLTAAFGRDFTLDECRAQAEICESAARLVRDYAGGLPSRIETGFSRSRAVLGAWARCWDQPGAARTMRPALCGYLSSTRGLLRDWRTALARRRAAGAE